MKLPFHGRTPADLEIVYCGSFAVKLTTKELQTQGQAALRNADCSDRARAVIPYNPMMDSQPETWSISHRQETDDFDAFARDRD